MRGLHTKPWLTASSALLLCLTLTQSAAAAGEEHSGFFQRSENFETVAFLVFGALFLVWERFRPARHIDRRRALKWDLAALVVLLVSVNLGRVGWKLGFAPFAEQLAAWFSFVDGWPSWLRVAVALVVTDLCLYWIHRAMHHPWLWPAHRWHHSAEDLYWFSGLRTSFFHAVLFAIPQILIPFFLLRLTPVELGVGFSIGIFVQFWTHANIDFPLGPLRHVIVTPQFHRMHHATETWTHRNFSVLFAIWDRLFGTYVDAEGVSRDYALGLTESPSRARMMLGV